MFKTLFNNTIKTMSNLSQSPREKGEYFEKLIINFLKNEPKYKLLFKDIVTYSKWANNHGYKIIDTGIDLVGININDDKFTAIQCKFYDENHVIQKADIDSFFTASGKEYFSHRIIVTTTNNFSPNVEDALSNQLIPVQIIALDELENSNLDWEKYFKNQIIENKPKKELRPHQKPQSMIVLKAYKSVIEADYIWLAELEKLLLV